MPTLLALSLLVPLARAGTLRIDDTRIGRDVPFPLRGSVEVLTDPGARLDVDSARRAPGWTGDQGRDVSKGLTDRALWLRVTLQNDTAAPVERVIESDHGQSDHLRAWVKDAEGPHVYDLGEDTPPAARPLPHFLPRVPVKLAPGGTAEVLLRLEDEGILTAPLRLGTQAALEAADADRSWSRGLTMGAFALVGVYASALYRRLRAPVLGWMAVLAGACLLQWTFYNGGRGVLLLPIDLRIWLGNRLVVASLAVTAASTFQVYAVAADLAHRLPGLHRIVRTLAVLALVDIVAAFLLPYTWSVGVLYVLPVGMLVLLLAVVRRAGAGDRVSKRLASALLTLVTGYLLGVFTALGWLPANAASPHYSTAGVLLHWLLLSDAIAVNAAILEEDRLATEAARHAEELRSAELAAHAEALAARERALAAVLDATGDALVRVDAEGTVLGPQSAPATAWFGDGKGRCLWLWLPLPPTPRALLSFGFGNLLGGMLPFAIAARMLPSRFEHDGRSFLLHYARLPDEDSILVVVRDVSAEVAAERAGRDQRALQGLTRLALADRGALRAFVGETDALVARIVGGDDVAGALHTLKGNAAAHGLEELAERAHGAEEALADDEIRDGALCAVQQAWGRTGVLLRGPLSGAFRDTLEVDVRFVEALRARLRGGEPSAVTEAFVARWSHPTGLAVAERLASAADDLARRLARPVQIEADGPDVHLRHAPPEAVLASLVHLARNAVDHGIGTAAQRAAAGRPAAGRILLGVRDDVEGLTIVVEDDGMGVDLSRLATRAEARGLTVPEDPWELPFLDGLSSREGADATSGRGVGLAEVRRALRAHGGSVGLGPRDGGGTRVVVRLPPVGGAS